MPASSSSPSSTAALYVSLKVAVTEDIFTGQLIEVTHEWVKFRGEGGGLKLDKPAKIRWEHIAWCTIAPLLTHSPFRA